MSPNYWALVELFVEVRFNFFLELRRKGRPDREDHSTLDVRVEDTQWHRLDFAMFRLTLVVPVKHGER